MQANPLRVGSMKTVRDVSAGGVVYRRRDGCLEIVLVGRAQPPRWGLPKGAPSRRESLEEAALREVREETGIEARLVCPLVAIDYWFTLNGVGHAKTVRVERESCTLIGGAGKKEKIQDRIRQIRAQMEQTESEYDKEKFSERLAKLTGGVAIIKVGAATEADMKQKKGRVEDALHATRAAVAEGILPVVQDERVQSSYLRSLQCGWIDRAQRSGPPVVYDVERARLIRWARIGELTRVVVVTPVGDSTPVGDITLVGETTAVGGSTSVGSSVPRPMSSSRSCHTCRQRTRAPVTGSPTTRAPLTGSPTSTSGSEPSPPWRTRAWLTRPSAASTPASAPRSCHRSSWPP